MAIDFRTDQNWQRGVRIGLILGALAFMALSLAAVLLYRTSLTNEQSEAKDDIAERSDEGARELERALGHLSSIVDDTWAKITEEPTIAMDPNTVGGLVDSQLANNADVNGVMFARAAPGDLVAQCPKQDRPVPDGVTQSLEADELRAEAQGAEFFAPYANRASGSEARVDLHQAELDRPYYCLDWYLRAINSEAADPTSESGVWIDPRFGQVSNVTLAFYSRAVVVDGEVIGVVAGTTAIDNLSSRLNGVGINPHGYSFITQSGGRLLTHPIGRWVDLECSVLDEFNQLQRDTEEARSEEERENVGLGCNASIITEWVNAPQTVSTQAETLLEYRDPVTKESALISRSSVGLAGDDMWNFYVVDLDSSALSRNSSQSRWLQLAGFGVITSAFLILLFAAVLVANRGNLAWVMSTAFALAMFTFIGWVWFLQTTTSSGEGLVPARDFDDVVEVATDTITSAREAEEDIEEVQQVTVGLFLQSIEFTGANDVAVSGLIWQSGPSQAASMPPVFPEATSPPDLEPVWPSEKDLALLKESDASFGWQFSLNLRQQFDYSEYPLDQNQIWLQLWPGQFEFPTILLPDIDSFLVQAPSSQPGLATELVLEGWEIERSFFSQNKIGINTELGILATNPNQLDPGATQLYFVVDVRRKFVGPFVSQLIPLMAINLMLFAALMLTKPRRRKGVEIEDSFGTIGYVAALFFSVIVSHNDLRSRLEATRLVFLENFYFTTYLLLILVAVNSLLPAPERFDALALERSNLWPKLAFWPLFGSLTLMATLVAFL